MTTTHADPRSLRLAGSACLVGAAMMTVLAVATQVVQASTDVPKHQWSYPWSSGTSIAFYLFAAGSQLLLVIGVLGLGRSRVAGTSRSAQFGVGAALAGTTLIVVGHIASIPIRGEHVDDTWPHVLEGVFGIGTVLSAAGFLLAGRATIRSGVWHGWRRFTPLALGIWSAVLIGLQFTPVLPIAVGVYGLCFLAVGAALVTRRRGLPTSQAEVQRA